MIAGKGLRDPNFYKSVVLIVEHGSNGAMGLVINRPSEVTVARALTGHFDLPDTEDLVYVGGPVEESALFILHNADDLDDAELPVLPGLYVGSSADVFETVVRRVAEGDADVKFRVYSGCAGWAPDQLEGELERNDWRVCPASAEYVFHPDVYNVWERAFEDFRRANPLAPGLDLNPEAN